MFGSLECNIYLCTRNQEMIATISRSGAVVARWAHNPKVVSSSLASATKESPRVIDLRAFSIFNQAIGRCDGSPDKPGGLSIQLCKSEKKEFYIRYSS